MRSHHHSLLFSIKLLDSQVQIQLSLFSWIMSAKFGGKSVVDYISPHVKNFVEKTFEYFAFSAQARSQDLLASPSIPTSDSCLEEKFLFILTELSTDLEANVVVKVEV